MLRWVATIELNTVKFSKPIPEKKGYLFRKALKPTKCVESKIGRTSTNYTEKNCLLTIITYISKKGLQIAVPLKILRPRTYIS